MKQNLIDEIISDIESRKERAISVNSKLDMADICLRGRIHHGAICAGLLMKGNKIIFRSSSKNTHLDGPHDDFMIISSKSKKDIGAEFVLLTENDGVIYRSDQQSDEDVEGLFFVGFQDDSGMYVVLLSVSIKENGMNTSTLIIDADAEHRDSICRLACLVYRGSTETNV